MTKNCVSFPFWQFAISVFYCICSVYKNLHVFVLLFSFALCLILNFYNTPNITIQNSYQHNSELHCYK